MPSNHFTRLDDEFFDFVVPALKGRVKSVDIVVYAVLQRHRGMDDRCWPSYRHIADHALADRKTIMASIRRLEAAGLITVMERTAEEGDQDSHMYHIRPIADVMEDLGLTAINTAGTERPVNERAAKAIDACSGFESLVRRLARQTGIPEDAMGPQFWSNWNSALAAMRKKLQDTPYGDGDIQKALIAFYRAHYSFETPKALVGDLLLAIGGKLQKRYRRDNRPHLYFPEYDAPAKASAADDEITVSDLLAMGADNGGRSIANRWIH